MVKIGKLGSRAFKEYIKRKKVIVFGAGRALDSCIDIYLKEANVIAIADNKCALWEKNIEINKKNISIISVEKMIYLVSQMNKNQYIIMITSPNYAYEMVEQLNQYEELDNAEVFLQVLIRNTKEDIPTFDFTKGRQRIPKKIHYIWVGKKTLPENFRRYIETWKFYNPDYEIIQWDESNYSFDKCDYVRETYESGSWGFVPNYARLDIIYNEGGIYLDTDVEVIRNFDNLLQDKAFFNMGCADRINQGCGFGSIKGNPIIKSMMEQFEKSHFLKKNGEPEKRQCHTFINPVIENYGFKLINEYQKINEIVIYPTEVMSPLTLPGMDNYLSKKTVSIHHEVGSWKEIICNKGYRNDYE